jgi:two-component system, OmpR family, KDP operon response regulator KdpE
VKVLVVDDDHDVLEAVAVGFRFQWRDCVVVTATDGAEGLQQFYRHSPDIVILDIGLPERTGFEVLQEIRRISDVPVVLVTGRESEASQVRGLDLGADDYVTKPFSILTLLARVRAILRRTDMESLGSGATEIKVGDLIVDSRNQQVLRDGKSLNLTPAEFRLLMQLVRSPQRLLPHQVLRERVWGSSWEASPNDLKSLVSRLRTKLGDDSRQPRYIETQRGLGYRFLLWPGHAGREVVGQDGQLG